MRTKTKQINKVERRDEWEPRCNETVRELLDHLARELAEEYIRLMKEAALSEEGKSR